MPNSPAVEPGDILAIRRQSWFSDLVIQIIGPPISHVGLFLTGEPPLVIEALSRVKTRPLGISMVNCAKEKASGGLSVAYVLKPKNITDAQRVRIVEAACTMSAETYGYGKLLLQGLDVLARTEWFTRHWTFTTMPICSWLVARAFSSEGLHFGVPDNSATPKDIWDFAVANPEKYAVLRIT